MSGGLWPRLAPVSGFQDIAESSWCDLPQPHLNQRADQISYHVSEKSVRFHDYSERPGILPDEFSPINGPDGIPVSAP